MGLLVENDLIRLAGWVGEINKNTRLQETKLLRSGEQCDVFLAHGYQDRDLILGVRLLLEQAGLSVHVDWSEDDQMHRGQVSEECAKRLRRRMRRCRSLLYVHLPDAPDGKWMPWELGFMDSFASGRCAIVPIFRNTAPSEFQGQGFLGLFPYLAVSVSSLYIHADSGTFVTFRAWLEGANPSAQAQKTSKVGHDLPSGGAHWTTRTHSAAKSKEIS